MSYGDHLKMLAKRQLLSSWQRLSQPMLLCDSSSMFAWNCYYDRWHSYSFSSSARNYVPSFSSSRASIEGVSTRTTLVFLRCSGSAGSEVPSIARICSRVANPSWGKTLAYYMSWRRGSRSGEAQWMLRRLAMMAMKLWYFFSIFWWWLRHCSACLVATNSSIDLKILSMRRMCRFTKCPWWISRNQWYRLFYSVDQWPLFTPAFPSSRRPRPRRPSLGSNTKRELKGCGEGVGDRESGEGWRGECWEGCRGRGYSWSQRKQECIEGWTYDYMHKQRRLQAPHTHPFAS